MVFRSSFGIGSVVGKKFLSSVRHWFVRNNVVFDGQGVQERTVVDRDCAICSFDYTRRSRELYRCCALSSEYRELMQTTLVGINGTGVDSAVRIGPSGNTDVEVERRGCRNRVGKPIAKGIGCVDVDEDRVVAQRGRCAGRDEMEMRKSTILRRGK